MSQTCLAQDTEEKLDRVRMAMRRLFQIQEVAVLGDDGFRAGRQRTCQIGPSYGSRLRGLPKGADCTNWATVSSHPAGSHPPEIG